MRPNGEELLRGIQGTLNTYILPEVQTAHARLELVLAQMLLGVIAAEWDGAAQRLVDDNEALRELARRGAEALATAGGPERAAVADELRSLADEADPSLHLSDLSTANGRLHDLLARLCALLEPTDKLRAAVIEHLRLVAESRTLSLLGPRADG